MIILYCDRCHFTGQPRYIRVKDQIEILIG